MNKLDTSKNNLDNFNLHINSLKIGDDNNDQANGQLFFTNKKSFTRNVTMAYQIKRPKEENKEMSFNEDFPEFGINEKDKLNIKITSLKVNTNNANNSNGNGN